MTSIDIESLDDEHEQRRDFRRANGAPLVSDPERPGKFLRYSRPSNYAKPLDDEHALNNWRIWKAMEGVAASKALQAQVRSTKDEDRDAKREIREKALDKGEANERADLGTALHAMTRRMEDPTDIFDPGEFGPDLDAYMRALDVYGLVSEFAEVPVINDEYRAAGTADRIYRLRWDLTAPDGTVVPAGSLIVGDIKTGRTLDFSMPGHAVQLALYVRAKLYDVVGEIRLPTPEWNQDWALILHLPVGKALCEVRWVSVERGNWGAWIAHEIKEWQRQWKNGELDCPLADPPTSVTEIIVEELGAQVVLDREIFEPMLAFACQRIAQIGTHERARAALPLAWPEGVPTPKQGITELSDLMRVLDVLDEIETKFSLPFLPDPRAEWSRGKHKHQIQGALTQ